MIYWLSACDPAIIHDQIKEFDNIIDSSLQHIIGIPVYHNDRLTMHVPLSRGGLGIAIATFLAECICFISRSYFNLQANMLPRASFSTARAKIIDNGVPVPLLIINEQPTVVSPLLTKLRSSTRKSS
jgi:hypothetical protein